MPVSADCGFPGIRPAGNHDRSRGPVTAWSPPRRRGAGFSTCRPTTRRSCTCGSSTNAVLGSSSASRSSISRASNWCARRIHEALAAGGRARRAARPQPALIAPRKTMAAPVTPPPRRSFGRRTNLVLFIGMVVGLALVLGAIATNSDIMLLALPPFRSRPAADRAALRFPAALSGVGLAALGVALAHAATTPEWFDAGLV